jgi:outer membrane protein TolC
MKWRLPLLPVPLVLCVNRRTCSMKKGNQSKRAFRKWTTMATCVLAMVSVANGQERKITLQEAIDLALRQNHAVKIAQYDVAAEQQKQRGAKSDYFPSLKNDSNALYVNDVERVQVPPGTFGAVPGGPLIPPSRVNLTQGDNSFQTSGTQLSQPLTQLIGIHYANKAAAAELGISKASLKKTSTDVIYSVHQLYYALLTTQLQRKAAELQITATSETLAENGEQFKHGSLLQVALVESRANSLEAKETLLTADMQIADLTVQLDDALGLPLNTKLDLDPDVDTAFDLPSREDALRTALKANPEVQEAIQKVQEARAAEGGAKSEYIPDVTGLARYSYQNGVPFTDHNFGTFGVHFSYDLFDGGKRRALVRERRSELSEAEEALERAKDEVGVRIATVYDKLETTRAMVDVAKEYLAARRQNVQLAEDQFTQGTAMASQRDTSRAQLITAQAKLLEASLEYRLARDELTRVLGDTTP